MLEYNSILTREAFFMKIKVSPIVKAILESNNVENKEFKK